jgi:quinol-cytochrome oxidoreductase complex cytochrome b subunit/cytochrome c2
MNQFEIASTERDRSGFSVITSGLYTLLTLQLLCGIFLAISGYSASDPHATTTVLRETKPFVVGFHYWASALSLLLSILTLVYAIVTCQFARGRKATYYSFLAIFGVFFISQLTGNLLPGDVHDVRTVVVEAGVAARTPIVGSLASQMVQGGPSFTENSFKYAFNVHILCTLVLLVPLVLRFLRGPKFHVFQSNGAILGVLFGIVAALLTFIPFPRGEAATPADFTSYDAVVSWYVWPMHGALNAFESLRPGLGWLGSALIPGAFGLLLFIAPIISTPQRANSIRAGLILFLALFAVFSLGWGGSFAPLTGNQDVHSPNQPQNIDHGTINEEWVKLGKVVFEREGCANCHGIDGSKSSGAPELSTVSEKYDRETLKKFILDPTSVKKGSTMPAYGDLKGKVDLDHLVEFLVKKR